ncbi:PQQ-binding-like beta-propeller repeat protein [Flavivirga spongiicola]|uniref:PQQ-like beta-propeller repeat protein n=1 Tax=Flavivirga spongiicola TaxID=421621 RepID=A0ABU7XXB8_9FLAO|nr:PQQ-binding-like beta-propeller repeat protein [Flavivirga sp. MEBiC05379]MDO5980207.1 PQQ-binding-like beta-propeller repeat protein [Flavivirga sp. MEBiC05379]
MKLPFRLLFCYLLISLVLISCSSTKKNVVTVTGSENQWPMSGGPDGSWKIETSLKVPTKWSVRTGENIKWKKTLPEGGQSGIAVWGDKIFLTINPPNDDPTYSEASDVKGGATNKDIVLFCLNSNNGDIVWNKTIKGTIESEYNYGFSDATTPTPMTDGKHVWAINASGGMACFSMEGHLVWERTWQPIPVTPNRPFNKQFDSIIFEDFILNVEPAVENDSIRTTAWNYLHAFDKNTGNRLWVTKAAVTNYNTPVLGETKDGKPAILMGRGGPHSVPERPVGLSLISLHDKTQGEALWHWEPKEKNNVSGWGALSTQHWNGEKASWFYEGKSHLTIDTKTGKLVSQKDMRIVDLNKYDTISKKYNLQKDVEIKDFGGAYHYHYHCNIPVGEYVYFMGLYKPFIKRHHTTTGKTEYLEVPEEMSEDGGYIWKKQSNDGLNSQGQLHSSDNRTRGGGFQKCFLGSPTVINDYIYFTSAIGIVYVIDANAEKLDESAIIAINDLGERGKTWTVNSLSFASGNIYHRTMKEIVCIGK